MNSNESERGAQPSVRNLTLEATYELEALLLLLVKVANEEADDVDGDGKERVYAMRGMSQRCLTLSRALMSVAAEDAIYMKRDLILDVRGTFPQAAGVH